MTKKHEPGMAYDMKKLNKVFAFLSFLLLVTVGWMFLEDYMRPWKRWQIKAQDIKKEKIKKDILEAEKKIDKKKLAQLEKDLVLNQKAVDLNQEEIDKVNEEIADINKRFKVQTMINGDFNANVSATTFNYEIAQSHYLESGKLKDKLKAEKLLKKLKTYKAGFAESKDKLKAIAAEKKIADTKLLRLAESVTKVKSEMGKMLMKKKLLLMAEKKTDTLTNPVWLLRNAPIIDWLDPTIKIQQVHLPNLKDDLYFQKVPKVDRCHTCHTFIDKPGYEDQPQPFTTHPRLHLFAGSDSPHSLKKMGCTSCHQGQGHRVHDFQSVSHTPNSPEQAKEWAKKYNWHPPHKVPQPMFPKRHFEAGCVKCHKGVEAIPGSITLNKGWRKIEQYGCYGCHKIKGWEHKRSPGPSLTKIASKVSKEFIKNWVWAPKSFNEHANMPQFFNLDNNKQPKHMVKNIAEVNAMAEYLYDKSKEYRPFKKYTGGDPEAGKKLISEVGCLSCHGVDGLEKASNKVKAYAGPWLQGSGSKLNGDWLVTWLKKPKHYQKDTIMPSFRLTDREANDMTAYILSLKNKKFEELKFEKLDKKVRDDLLVKDYFSAFDTEEKARARLAKMSDHERTVELGRRSINKYGCYACHNIEGFKRPALGGAYPGPELTNVGSKAVHQFGFGHEYDVEHTREAWIEAHLLNPRRWDRGTDKAFKDLLMMPNFHMTKEESVSMTTALLGQVSDYVPPQGRKNLSPEESKWAEGMKVVNHFNCIGCHKINHKMTDEYNDENGENFWGGDILSLYEDDINEGPPRLYGEGWRVRANWFHYFLNNVHTLRPWLKVRMPSYHYTNDQINKIVTGFQYKANRQTFVKRVGKVEWLPGEEEGAKKLWNALECVSCHSGGFNSEEAQAPNLHYSKLRLRPTWIKRWFENPQTIMPGTRMPSFWEGGESLEDTIFGGDPEKQMNALVKYLQSIGYDKFPKGLDKE
ncbi:MAG: c-type cytochrome [Bdellovibrionota bacterium]|nr:c-type cytochrome [Bdellovibrionota bacterium]